MEEPLNSQNIRTDCSAQDHRGDLHQDATSEVHQPRGAFPCIPSQRSDRIVDPLPQPKVHVAPWLPLSVRVLHTRNNYTGELSASLHAVLRDGTVGNKRKEEAKKPNGMHRE